jgi:iron complex transport system substrate-binding protein
MKRMMLTGTAVRLGPVCCVVLAGACSPTPAGKASTPQPVPQRIITIAPNAAEIVAALGAADGLVGVSEFCVYPPGLAALPRVGGLFNPNLESILQLRPDLVILRGTAPELERLCHDSGIRLYHDPTENYEDIYTAIAELGEILHRQSAADALASNMRKRIAAIHGAVRRKPRPRVFFSIARDPTSLARVSSSGANTFVDSLITLAGGENIFHDLDIAYPEVSLEEVLTAQPDVIIEAMPEKETTSELERRVIEQWRSLGMMPAVRDGRIYILTDANLLIPSPRVVDSITRLAGVLHPEVTLD